MAVTKRLRYEILRRDNHACKYCGSSAPEVKLTVDHVLPVALGGGDEASNLVTACADCNSGKSASSPDAAIVADVDMKAARWAQAMEEFSQLTNHLFNHWSYSTEHSFPWVPDDWENSIRTFIAAGLDVGDLEELMTVALISTTVSIDRKWKYFCGCCWTRIKQSQEVASSIVSQWEAEDGS